MNLSDSQAAGQPGITPIARKKASDAVTEQLVAMIHSRQHFPDGRLPSEDELARSFGVARSVIRESLGQLRVLGLLESKTGRGSFVASRTVDPALTFGGYSPSELQEVRMHLELHTARLAAGRSDDEHLQALDRARHEFETSASANERRFKDVAFHAEIARATGNSLFVRLVEDLSTQIREQARAISTPARVQQASAEHSRIYAAIAARDEDRAVAAMQDHLVAVTQALLIENDDPTEHSPVAEDQP